MKSRLVRLGVVLAATLGLISTSTPAEASTTVKTVTFTGTTTVTGGLGLPCTTTGNVPTTFDTTKCPVTGHGYHRPFSFSSTTCVKFSFGVKGKTGGPDLCAMVASGTIWGWCGLSSGLGVGTLVNLSGGKGSVTVTFHWVGVGGTLVFTGGDGSTTGLPPVAGVHEIKVTGPGTTNFTAVMQAVPNPLVAGTSCMNKTGSEFIMVGEAVFEV